MDAYCLVKFLKYANEANVVRVKLHISRRRILLTASTFS